MDETITQTAKLIPQMASTVQAEAPGLWLAISIVICVAMGLLFLGWAMLRFKGKDDDREAISGVSHKDIKDLLEKSVDAVNDKIAELDTKFSTRFEGLVSQVSNLAVNVGKLEGYQAGQKAAKEKS